MGAWVGLHHPSSHVRSLPSFTFLPFSLGSMVMMTTAGGLVCFQKLPLRRCDPAVHVSSSATSLEPHKRYWIYDFIVYNPLSKKWRRLPSITPIVANHSLLKLLVVNPKNYSQEYHFLLLGRDVSWKYLSSQHKWESVDHHHLVWNSSESQRTTTTTTTAGHGKFVNGSGGSTIFKRRLYCLNTSSTTYLSRRQLHAIHQFDLQTLTWLDDLVWSLHLGATTPIKTVPHPYEGAQPATTPLQPESLLNLQLVVCAGILFAVLPVLELNAYPSNCLNNPLTSRAARHNMHRSWKEIISEHQNIYRASLRFRIFNLLEVPETSEALESHESMCTATEFNQRDYYAKMSADMDLPAGPLPDQRISPSQLWFSCTAKDGKI
jgi:hypothetical protein